MSGCCNEHGCRRSQPFKLRRGGFSGRWFLVSRYRQRAPEMIESMEKHDIHDELMNALLEAGWTPPKEVP